MADSFIEGLSVAQVRAIFQLPAKFQSYKGTLAYVEWFTPLRSYSSNVGMYQVRRSTQMGRRRASIIPIEQIVQTCHLIPKFGRSVPAGLTSENALEKVDTFYINPDLVYRCWAP